MPQNEHTPDYPRIQRSLKKFFGAFPQVVDAHERMEALRSYACVHEEPDGLALIGETGTGKSRLLERYAEQHPRVVHPEYTEIPVFYVEVPARCTIKTLASLMLRQMGSEFWNKGREEELTYQLITLLKACKVRLIIFDEVNHLADRGGQKSLYLVGDWIKLMSKESKVPIVLAGTPAVLNLLRTNEQLGDRFLEIITLRPLSADDASRHEFDAILQAFERLMIGLKIPDFTQKKAGEAMAFATAGRLRAIRRLLVRAVSIAARNNQRVINFDTLSAAFLEVIFPGARDQRNPFKPKFNGVPLTGTGEPFAPRVAR